jgi:hypothetical protein
MEPWSIRTLERGRRSTEPATLPGHSVYSVY